MKAKEWRQELGNIVCEYFATPELEEFYALPVNRDRAQLYLKQLTIYVRNRRNYWPQIAANCPEFEVKQRIYAHEYEELVEDEYSSHGHLDLVVRQAKEVGLSLDEMLNAEPLPSTRAAVYGWWWIARHCRWQQALAASTIAEWTNDERLLGDFGGGNCTRLLKSWGRGLGLQPEQMPNFTAHSKADERHADMFLEVLEQFIPPGEERDVLNTAKESMEIHRAFYGGMTMAMARM